MRTAPAHWRPAFLFLMVFSLSAPAQDFRSRLKGLVYEAEDWTTPKDAWVKDQHPPDKWCLWTKEEDVFRKRSGGQSLQSPPIKEDRKTPEEGAPPLHTHITGIPPGVYQVWMNSPCRSIALSDDGKTWRKVEPRGEIDLGMRNIKDGAFDLWLDDRYASPGRLGSCYYDYIRFVKVKQPRFSHITAFTLPDGRTQISWITDKPIATGSVAYGLDGKLDRHVSSDMKSMRNHAVALPDLERGSEYTAQVQVADGIFASAKFKFVAGERPEPPETKEQKIPLSVIEPTPFARKAWPVTSGIPFKQGMLAPGGYVHLVNARGGHVPAQFEAMAHWPDGSVRWLLVDFQADTQPGKPTEYVLETSPNRPPIKPPLPIATEEDGEIILDARVLRVPIDKKVFALFQNIALDQNGDGSFSENEIVTGKPLIGNGWIVDAEGKGYGLAKPDLVTIETNGPMRATVRIEGDFVAKDGAKLFRYRARLTAYRGKRFLRLQWTIGNNNIDDVLTPLTRAALRLPIRKQGEVTGCLSDGKAIPITGKDDLWILQDYDNRLFKSVKGTKSEGERDMGLACVKSGDITITAMIRDFWQTYPKGIAIKPDGLHLRLLPALPADQYRTGKDRTDIVGQISLYYCYDHGKYLIKRGLEYTADILIRFDRGDMPPAAETAQHFQHMLFASAKPEYYCPTRAFWEINPQKPDEFPRYTEAFNESFANLEKGRRTMREYGWMNYGDWWGERRWNWGNSEYDLQYVLALHFAQTGDLAFFWRGDQMARHNTSIDVCHYPWRTPMRELVYAHSVGHVGGFFERDDPRITNERWAMSGFVAGAMDGSGGHSFQGGNFLYGFLTGDRRYLEIAEKECWNQATTYTPRWRFSIERACGWALYNALSAYESTLNPYYLNAARIYLEKVYELQDPETGGWRMPQGAPECDCGVKHIGGKAFATGVLLHALTMYDRVRPDPKVKQSIVRGADWLIDHSWNEEKHGFRYKTGCPKYYNQGWYTTLVTDGIAYAYEITKNDKYKDFLLRTVPAPLGKRTGSGRSAGKSFASHFHNLPHMLYYIKRWGVTSLPLPPPPLKIGKRSRVFIDEKGQGKIQIVVFNPGKETLPCELKVVSLPDGCTAEPRTAKWNAPPGAKASPDIRITAGTGSIKLLCTAGKDVRREFDVAIVPEPKGASPGGKIGFVGPDDHYTLMALREVGANIERIPDLRKSDLSQYRTIVVGSDVPEQKLFSSNDCALRIASFVKGGGRLVFSQINDDRWRIDTLPVDLEVQDTNGQAGEITDPSHPLFKNVPTIKGTTCYDTIAYAGPEWKALAKDTEGRPCILSAKVGSGEILVIEASFDRWASPKEPGVGVSNDVCRQVMKNLAAYLK
ncbi:MAG: hypothetical protein GXP25_10700 [Planctomycetes bacterium]|nr:hypothetical protein [Planctomycetota bacterium]